MENEVYLIMYYFHGKNTEFVSYVKGENQDHAIVRWFNHLVDNNDYYIILSMITNYYMLSDSDIIAAKGFRYEDTDWALSNAIKKNLDKYVAKGGVYRGSETTEIVKIVKYHTGDSKAYIGARDKLIHHVERVRIHSFRVH